MTLRLTLSTALAAIALAAACRAAAPAPVPVDTRNDQCRHCQMMVSSRLFASEIVAPGEEPLFFDDLGCLAAWLQEKPLATGAVIYVADHRTGDWVPATRAVFSRVPNVETPMGSRIVAHADEMSRSQDQAASGGTVLSREEALGPGSATR
jgi:copper chaperone NosL